MKRKSVSYNAKVNIYFVILVILFFFFQFLMGYCDRNFTTTPFNGVFMSFQLAICLLMIQKDSKRGYIISTTIITLTMLFMLGNVIARRVLSPIPGVCNSVIYLFALFLLTKQFEYREKDAVTDMLTGLRNRRGLFQYLDKMISNNEPFHIIYIDLGNFKFLNDNYGHSCGDYVMMQIADRMKKIIKGKGICTRIGGDEFVLVLHGGNDPKTIADEVITKLSEKIPVAMEDSTVDCYLTAYAGISCFPDDTDNYEDLLKYADIAMYRALHDKKEKVCFFNHEMHKSLNRRVEVEKLIKEALESNYFYLVYQPQYSLNSKHLRGFEALLRMKDANGNFVSPGEFIPIAEKGELILSIDDFVLKRAMTDFKDIIDGKDIVLSVNISAKNISNISFVEKVKKILAETQFPARNLEIEITEYCLIESVDDAIENIKALRNIGVQVALDDFGTGYTSLSYLAKMPINLLKIDKSLVDDIEKDKKSRDFVNTVISLGHQMGCDVISEGVETEQQLHILGDNNCDFVQGYVWSRPLDLNIAKDLANDEPIAAGK